MNSPIRTLSAAGIASAFILGTSRAEDPAKAPDADPLNYKIEVRCKFGDTPEQVFRLTDAEGEFAAEHPSPPIVFEGKLERREGKVFVLSYDCAWRQDIKEAPRDPENPKFPKGKGSFSQGGSKGKARVAVGRPALVFDSATAKLTITLVEIPALIDSSRKAVEIRSAVRLAEGE